ncbi:TauD/TfdA family dioxygenase [Actinomadura macra]|uniref:TauD/TfdA family dioxygenase n=1 Tax=Actinomadura macra TaxID=46164 RepID=UPI0012FA860A|nr:TauD/TfdA family dioxygenase [Actinomadura macra]
MFVVDPMARKSLERLVAEIDVERLSEGEAYARLPELVSLLPTSVIGRLVGFREGREQDALLVRGVPLGVMGAVATPRDPVEAPRTILGYHAVALAMIGVLGTPFGYRTQQLGRLVNNIAPSPAAGRSENVGIGSSKPFDLHTEDAFMRRGPSYLMLACVRNPQSVPTTVSGLSKEDVGPWLEPLREPRYIVRTNPAQREWREDKLRPGPVIWGESDRPFLRFNAVGTTPVKGPGVDLAEKALNKLGAALLRNVQDLTHGAGDILVINNYRLCHARRAFRASFDGSDRWLLRVVAYRDPAEVAGLASFAPYPTLEPR